MGVVIFSAIKPLNYTLVSLIVSLGLFCGALLGWMAKEELKPGKKYLVFFQDILMLLIPALFVFFRQPILALIASVPLIARISAGKKYGSINSYLFSYSVFALVFFLNSRHWSFFPSSALMFILGLPTGSLIYMKKCWLKNIILVSSAFFLLSLGLLGIYTIA